MPFEDITENKQFVDVTENASNPEYENYLANWKKSYGAGSIPRADNYAPALLSQKDFEKEENKKNFSIPRTALATAETGLNLAGGVGGMFVAPPIAYLQSVYNNMQGKPPNFEGSLHSVMGAAGSLGTTLADATGLRTHYGDKANEFVGEAINELGIPLMGAHIPRGANVKKAIGRAMEKEFPPEKPNVTPEDIIIKARTAKAPTLDPQAAGQRAFTDITATLAEGATSPYVFKNPNEAPTNPSAMDWTANQLRGNDAQAQWQARQDALAAGVKKQVEAERNAAYAATREGDNSASHQQWVAQQRDAQAAVPRDPGSLIEWQDPLATPQLGDPFINPERPSPPIPSRGEFPTNEAAAPVERAVQEKAAWEQRNQERDAENAKARQAEEARRAQEPALQALEEHLRNTQYAAPGRRISGFKGQRGAINPQLVKDITNLYKLGKATGEQVLGSFKGAFTEHEFEQINKAMNDNKHNAIVLMSPDKFHSLASGRTPGELNTMAPPLRADIKEGLASKEGLYEIPHLIVRKDGQIWGHEGRHRMDVFKEMDVTLVPVRMYAKDFKWSEHSPERLYGQDYETTSPEVKRIYSQKMPERLKGSGKPTPDIPVGEAKEMAFRDFRDQRGGLNPQVLTDAKELFKKVFYNVESTPHEVGPKTPVKDSLTTPVNPETIAKKQALRDKARAVGYSAYDRIETPEEALAGMDPKHDMTRIGANNLRSGSEAVLRTNTQNTIVNYIRTARQNASNAFEEFSKTYVTSKETGIVPLVNKLYKNMEQANAVADALLSGDRKQFVFTDAHFKEMGWNDLQIQVYQRVRAGLDARYAYASEQAGLNGYKPFSPREGYLPSNFGGNYLALVGHYNEKGRWVTKGVASANTKYGLNAMVEKYKEMGPEYKDTLKINDRGLKENAGDVRNYNGFNEIVAFMAEHDPEMAKAKVIADQHMQDTVRSLYRFDVHEIKKSGVKGSLGDRPGLSRENNTKDLFSSVVDHLETGFKYDAYQTALMNAEKLINDPKVKSEMPNTSIWGQKYVDHIKGQNLNKLGAAINSGLNGVFDAVGLGVSIPRASMQAIQSASTSLMMGFGNLGFAAMQLSQVLTGGLPESLRIKQATGLSTADIGISFVNAGLYSPVLASGKYAHLAPEHLQKAWEWAKAHGLSDFSEAQLAHELGGNRFTRGTKTVINAPIIYSEKMTRPPIFLAYADMFHKAGYRGEEAYTRAQSATDYAMVAYMSEERPPIYQAMGEIGKTLGALATYKHNLVEQHVSSIGNARKQPEALIAMAAIAAGFYGVSGLPGYNEADKLFKAVTKKNFREVLLSDPDKKNAVMDGLISYGTNLDFQTRMSMSSLLPDPTHPLSIAPHVQNFVGITAAAIEAAIKQDEMAIRNLRQKALPAQIRNMDEVLTRTDEKGNVYDSKGMLKTERPRTHKESLNRALWGLRPLDERLKDDNTWTREQRYLSKQKKLSDVSKRFESALALRNEADMQKWADEYAKLGGDVQSLLSQDHIKRMLIKMNESPRTRMSGLPGDTIGSLRRWEALQNPAP